MTLLPGTTLGPYRVTGKIGEGGMGEVFRAHDGSLSRDAAIKVLPAALAGDPDRLARFRREAQVLASLNHSNIAHVYGFESAVLPDGSSAHFLAMELVEGDDLAARIRRGAIPVDEAIAIAVQIVGGLEEAHDHGIIHRDLKPANIKVTAGGRVKVLDFGLAKALDPPSPAATAGTPADPGRWPLDPGPTMTSPALTAMGVVMGTAAYMSPEQARGRVVDQRADIWSFGVVLFEMLTGRHVFKGETVGDTLAAVLREDIPWANLPADTPPGVVRLLRRCLNRDPRQRLRSAADARIELEEALTHSEGALIGPPGSRTIQTSRTPWLVAGFLALLLLGTWSRTLFESEPATPVTRLSLELSPALPLSTLYGTNATLSPDGRTVAFVTESAGQTRLNVRRLDELDATPLAGTEGGRSPFFSSDGLWIGYQSLTGLMKIGVAGGAPVTIAEAGASLGRGGTWNGNTIVFSRVDTGLFQVSAEGGDPVALTALDASREERTHRWPSFLPGGKAVLFMVQRQGREYDDGTIEAVSLADGRRTILVRGGAFPRYAPGGFLLFVRKGVLYAVRFDAEQLRVEEPATPVLEEVLAWTGDQAAGDGSADFSVSDRGDLLYRTSGNQDIAAGSQFVWVDATGRETPAFSEALFTAAFEMSRDGRKLAIEGTSARGSGIFIKDLETGTLTPLTTDGAGERFPVWSPDGKRLAYSVRSQSALRIRTAEGTDTDVQVPSRYVSNGLSASAWTPDGNALILGTFAPETFVDITLVPLDGSPVRELVKSPRAEEFAQVSPDGRWVAYEGEEKGIRQVFITSIGTTGPRHQVSSRGGRAVRWSHDSRQLYFVETTGDLSQPEPLVVVSVDATGAVPRFGPPRERFRSLQPVRRLSYAVHPDGRLLSIKRTRQGAAAIDPRHAVLVTGWAAELSRRLAEGR